MFVEIDLTSISLGKDRPLFPCMGTKTLFNRVGNDLTPYSHALQIGIKAHDNCSKIIHVKLPYNSDIKSKKERLIKMLKEKYPVTVCFYNVHIYYYEYDQQRGYTGTADSFDILED